MSSCGRLRLRSRRSPQRHRSTQPALLLKLLTFSGAGLKIGRAPRPRPRRGFQSLVSALEQRMTAVELLYLGSKVIDLEDRSRRDNVRFLGFPETKEEEDVQSFLKTTLPQLTAGVSNRAQAWS
ncbi:hypothetical protein NDU88_009758 [Pleurodeles waltl]|uniref:Uncharacterized protein n=1 Tax=Pleurodeles waltl TaxID=8319 RepID=A0AAV7QWN4_PLEWA|nr:hypothetical protein NDU88_009758 [Pleurodeles waltl]